MIFADFWTQNDTFLSETLHQHFIIFLFCCFWLLLSKTTIFETFINWSELCTVCVYIVF